MKKMIAAALAIIIFISVMLFSVHAQAAVYTPDVEIYAEAYMLINLDDLEHPVVAQKNQDKKMYPASLTKIVTAMITLENVTDLSQSVTVSKQAYDILIGTGAQVAALKPGNELTVEQLLYLTLVFSACDAAEVLAEYVGGTREHFIDMMNEYAASLGCEATHFANPDGLHDDDQYTTAEDLAKITLAAMKNDTFMKISTTQQYKYKNTVYNHTNVMLLPGYLSYYYEYAEGIKTGSTSQAGYCVITKASKDGYNYLAIVLGSPLLDYNKDGYVERCSFIDAANLFKWAFNTLKFSTVFDEGEMVTEVRVENGKDVDTVQLVANEKVTSIVMQSFDKSTVIMEYIDKPESISAPVKKGDPVCKAKVIFGDEVIAEVELVAAQDVELSTILQIINALKRFFSLTVVRIVLMLIILFAIVYIVLVINTVKKGRKKKKARDEAYRNRENYEGYRGDPFDDLPPPEPPKW